MEGEKHKALVPDPEIDRLMPKPSGITETIKRNAKLEDTILFLPKAIKKVSWQVKKVAKLFEGNNLEETCRNIWERFYTRIQYCKDETNKEQIRSPRVTWWGRKGDCDDFTVLISACLCQLGIRHVLRIMKQTEEKGFQHIYPVAIAPNGKEIIIDCVVQRFNYEVPYIEKMDKEMDLEFLDGIEDDEIIQAAGNIDAEDLFYGDLGELGKKLRDTKLVKKVTQTANKVKEKAKQALHAVNKVNPATALLRAGVLASMKLNVFNIAGTLRYTYLSDAQAKQKGFNMSKFPRLRNIREKLEKIFHGAGGEIPNLKKSILEGKGNQNREVPLNGLSTPSSFSENSSLPQLLGAVAYKEELMCAREIGSLGIEPTTDAALAAATTAMAAIAALIKQLGPLKDGKGSEATPSTNETSASANTNTNDGGSADPQLPTAGDANKSESTDTSASATDKDQNSPANTNDKEDKGMTKRNTDPANQSFFERAKTWAKENKGTTAAVGLVSAGFVTALVIAGYKRMKKNKKTNKQATLSGIKVKRKGSQKIKIQRLR